MTVEDYAQGWPRLAAFLNSDDNVVIFRRFGQSQCRILVHLQAQITLLEQDLSKLDQHDSRSSDTLYRLKRVNNLNEEDNDQKDNVQKEKLELLQKKLAEYCKYSEVLIPRKSRV